MNKHPIQPLITDSQGVLRFKENPIVRYLLDAGPFDMNHIACKKFTREDREHFAQLIGYSLSGFGELSYVSDEVYAAASDMHAGGVSEMEGRNAHLRTTLDAVREGIREPLARLYGINSDDLGPVPEEAKEPV